MKTIGCIVVGMLVTLFGMPSVSALPPEEVADWREDIAFYRAELEERHIDLFHTVSKQKFDAELRSLSERLPELNNAQQVVVEMMRITRLIGDGHTQFPIMGGPHKHFPIKYRLFGASVRVVSAANIYGEQLGKKLVAVNGMPIAQVLEIMEPAVQPVENPYSLMSSQAFHLTVADMLFGAGITKDTNQAIFSFEDDAGIVSDVRIEAVGMADFVALSNQRQIRLETPFTIREIEVSSALWMGLDRESSIAYLYFASYPSMADMEAFGAKVRRVLEDEKIENLIIDFRQNGGGNFYKGLTLSSFILPVDTLDWNNGVYVLIGRNTYSAAMSNAAHFRSILNAKLVGEPTGGNPVGYSELGGFHLPKSKRQVLYSERFYRFENVDTEGVLPDVYVDMAEADFLAGKDSVLKWVMADILDRQN